MASAEQPTGTRLPSFVRKRNGRLAPFEPDKISSALFAASESLGQPNAFLARELTDGILHFLAEECDEPTPSTPWIADLVEKIVRELRQPELAREFRRHDQQRHAGTGAEPAEKPDRAFAFQFSCREAPDEVITRCLRDYSLAAVFAPDLVAAHRDGLLTLGDLETPAALAARVVDPLPSAPWSLAILQTRPSVGTFIALDGPEWSSELDGESFLRELTTMLRGTGLEAHVNLNSADPPAWATTRGEGPLFARQEEHRPRGNPAFLDDFVHGWLEDVTAQRVIHLNWHVSEKDFGSPSPLTQLLTDCEARVTFTMDRPRWPHDLGLGLDRKTPAALLTVGLTLPRLAAMAEVGQDEGTFLKKVSSLARMALSAAVQKRQFLRQRLLGAALFAEGFLVDRARLVIVPVGLEAVVRHFTGAGLCDSAQGHEMGCRVLDELRNVVSEEGRRRLVEATLDTAAGFTLSSEFAPDNDSIAGVTPWGKDFSFRTQLRVAAALQGSAGGGTAAIFLGGQCSRDERMQCLALGWKQGGVRNLQFLPAAPSAPAETSHRWF